MQTRFNVIRTEEFVRKVLSEDLKQKAPKVIVKEVAKKVLKAIGKRHSS